MDSHQNVQTLSSLTQFLMVHQTYSLSAASHQKAEAGWVVGDPEWACDMGLELGQLWPEQSMKGLMGSPRVGSSSPCQDATTLVIWKTSSQPVSAGRIPVRCITFILGFGSGFIPWHPQRPFSRAHLALKCNIYSTAFPWVVSYRRHAANTPALAYSS